MKYKTLSFLIPCIVILLMAGCAGGPNYASSSIPPLARDQGRILFYRTSALGAAVQPDVVNRLREMGLGEEQRIRLISRHPSLICQVCNARVALSQELAESILVEPLRKAS